MRTDTPVQALTTARDAALRQANVRDWHILSAALYYVEYHPEWFTTWAYNEFETSALTDAAQAAANAFDRVAHCVLAAAAELSHPETDDALLFRPDLEGEA